MKKKTAKTKVLKTKRFHIISVFPHAFDSYLKESFLKRAVKNKLISIKGHNIRSYSSDKHLKVDDRPFGGGYGMVLKVEPIWRAVQDIKRKSPILPRKRRTVLFSLRGKKMDRAMARRFAGYDELILICGRYEGVDERVAEHIADEEVSIGDFILSGGELPAMVLLEAACRYIPGFFGKDGALEDDKGSYPTYTRPELFIAKQGRYMEKWAVPEVLLSGNHKDIAAWRKNMGGGTGDKDRSTGNR